VWTYTLYLIAALYLGVLTSISPCPLATNIAAISYIGRKVDSPRSVLAAGLTYTFGRCVLYLGLAVFLGMTACSISGVLVWLQKYMHLALGPIFLVLGIFLLRMVVITGGGTMMGERLQRKIDSMGLGGAFLLGILFAASFCPTSAFLFFGLVTLVLENEIGTISTYLAQIGITSPEASVPGGIVVLPLLYGVGSAVPVIFVSAILAYSAKHIGRAFNVIAKIELGARFVTGWLFIILGIGFSVKYIFN
jgi:cytochrome c biogenesis protein CcdA